MPVSQANSIDTAIATGSETSASSMPWADRNSTVIRKFLGRRRVFRVRMWGSHDLALNSSVTSVIGPESLLVATFACVSFSRENHRSGFRDFCNTIGQQRTHTLQQNLVLFDHLVGGLWRQRAHRTKCLNLAVFYAECARS